MKYYELKERNGIGLFAVCIKESSDVTGWMNLIHMLAHEVDIYHVDKGVELFESELILVWFLFRDIYQGVNLK